MRFAALERAWREAASAYEREHVTPYLYRHPELFRLGSVEADEDRSYLRLTVDYPEDLELVRRCSNGSMARTPISRPTTSLHSTRESRRLPQSMRCTTVGPTMRSPGL